MFTLLLRAVVFARGRFGEISVSVNVHRACVHLRQRRPLHTLYIVYMAPGNLLFLSDKCTYLYTCVWTLSTFRYCHVSVLFALIANERGACDTRSAVFRVQNTEYY